VSEEIVLEISRIVREAERAVIAKLQSVQLGEMFVGTESKNAFLPTARQQPSGRFPSQFVA
jgi:hypothetical protein